MPIPSSNKKSSKNNVTAEDVVLCQRASNNHFLEFAARSPNINNLKEEFDELGNLSGRTVGRLASAYLEANPKGEMLASFSNAARPPSFSLFPSLFPCLF